MVIATRITEPFAKVVEEYMQRDAHVSPADLLRDALREKIRRDAPDLIEKMYLEDRAKEAREG